MKKTNILAILAMALAVLMLCSGCSAVIDSMENQELRQTTESLLDALIADDFQAAYPLVSAICSESEFRLPYEQMKRVLAGTDSYELKLLSVYNNSSLTNGQTVRSVSSVYEMTTDSGKIIVSVVMIDGVGLSSFYLTPYEQTDYYATGTLTNMKGASAIQWVLLLLNVIPLGITVFAIVDCCKQPIRRKALWILLIVLGFVTIGITISSSTLTLNYSLAWISGYSALIIYGSGAVIFRLLFPIGAIIYLIARHSLLKKAAVAAAPVNNTPEPLVAQEDDAPKLEDTPGDHSAT